MTAFRDAMMRTLHQATHDGSEDPDLRDLPIDECDELAPEGWIGEAFVAYDLAADAVLASPEMQAIRAVLGTFCVTDDHPEDWLPESVIEWVMA